MALKRIENKVPYGDTYVTEYITECDGICTAECFEQCEYAAVCHICGEVYCTKESDGCPKHYEEEEGG